MVGGPVVILVDALLVEIHFITDITSQFISSKYKNEKKIKQEKISIRYSCIYKTLYLYKEKEEIKGKNTNQAFCLGDLQIVSNSLLL